MTGHADLNFPAFHYVAKMLRDRKHIIYCPAESFGGETKLELQHYARFDIHLLLQVQGVVLLDGWERSKGCQKEVAIAEWLGLPFFRYIDMTSYRGEVYGEIQTIQPHLLISAREIR